MKRQNISSGTASEELAGYSRAVRVGNMVVVSGTTATDGADKVVGVGDIYAQCVFIFQKIERALQEAGASLNDVIRTRMYLVHVDDWPGASQAHAEFFGDIRPANTLLEVSALIGDEYLVEIEVDAIITEDK